MRTAVALGSNLGECLHNLHAARQAIVDLASVHEPVLSSAVYETEPVECEPGAGRFLNAVLEFDFDSDPLNLLRKMREIENALGRPPDHPRNVSRKIDIDLLYVGDTKMDSEELQLPHPRMHLRRFVLQPLADIRPDLILPGQTKTIHELLAQLNESTRTVRLTSNW